MSEDQYRQKVVGKSTGGVFWVWLCTCLLFALGLVFFVSKAYFSLPIEEKSPSFALQRLEPIPLAEVPAVEIPAFDENSQFLLTAFSLQGMRQITSAENIWEITNPGSVFAVQLIERDTLPVVHTSGFTVRYMVEGENIVLDESANGICEAAEDGLYFISPPIKILSESEKNEFVPFPIVKVEAFDAAGVLVASTKLTLPVTSEMGCHNCHRGAIEQGHSIGINNITAMDILSTHDRRNGTELLAQVKNGQNVSCRNCHNKESSVINLSAAMHGFHAKMFPSGAESCVSCHPKAEHFQRDIHASMGFTCSNCHGEMEDNALALLKAEEQAGKSTARRRMQGITPQSVDSVENILPREPWVNLPDCSTCHDFENSASSSEAFNVWSKNTAERFSRRFENMGKVRCGSCHGPVHATYEAINPLGDERDNIQPLQYQKLARPLGAAKNCAVCHTVDMEYSPHHEMMDK